MACADAPEQLHVTDDCTGCGACLPTCPEHTIRPVAGSGSRAGQPRHAALTVLAGRCTGCWECIEVCPADAIEVTSWI
jgi:formate hydrogenlyase subunit 6/NADH:ubiquinone oxidoreductase subunit I